MSRAKCFIACCLLLLGHAPSHGQSAPADNEKPARRHAETEIRQLLDQIKRAEDPALRVSLHIRVATFLWKNKFKEAGDVSEKTVEDLLDHRSSLPKIYADSLYTELLALLQKHVPALATRLVSNYKPTPTEINDTSGNPVAGAERGKESSPLEALNRALAGGEGKAAGIYFSLYHLEKENPAGLHPQLAGILAEAERRPEGLSVEVLFWLRTFYMREKTPPEMKARFLAVAIKALSVSHKWSDEQSFVYAYDLVNYLLPEIQRLLPGLHPQASAHAAVIAARLPRAKIERMEIEDRITRSTDPLSQLILEANAAANAPFKEDLLARAAQLALRGGRLRLAADLAAATKAEGNQSLWRDKFLRDVVNQALEKDDPTLAAHVASHIKSSLSRVAALQKLASYYFENKDTPRSREVLADAVKLAEASEDDADKAIAFLILTSAFLKIDVIRAPETTQEAIKVINRLPRPNPVEKADSTARMADTDALFRLVGSTVPAFRALAQKDEATAASLASGIQRQEVKAAATFGVITGLFTAGESAPAPGRQ